MRETVLAPAPAEAVWRILADPRRLPEWNPKIVDVEWASDGAPGLGDRFQVTYRMGGRDVLSVAEVTELEPQRRLTLRVTGDSLPPGAFALESYRLEPREGGTYLEQTLDLRRSGIPLWARLVMALVQRIGRPTGKRYLAQLAENAAVEGP